MSERKSGRKKHVVQGVVSEVKKSARALEDGKSVGESGFMRSFRRWLKGVKK